MIKKMMTGIVSIIILLSCYACGGYEPDYEFNYIEPGELPAPKVERSDPSFREHYPILEKYDKPVTITVAACQYELEPNVKKGTTPENQAFNKIAKKYLNIDLKYEVIGTPSYYDQRLSTAIAADTIPDMFYTTNSTLFTTLRDSGMLADLGDIFYYLNDELQENYLTYLPDILPTVMQKGKVYAFPMLTNNYAQAQKLYIRKDWLDIVGMQAPATVDEMIKVGQAFYDKRDLISSKTGIAKNRIIPFTMNKEITWQGSFSCEGFMNCFGSSIGAYFEGADGNLYDSNISEETKKAVEALHTMYEKNILDSDFASKSPDIVRADVKAGYVGMVFGEWWLPKDALEGAIKNTNVKGAEWTWVDIPSAQGVEAKPIVKKVAQTGYNLVTKKCKNPEAVAKLINLFYDVYYSDDAYLRYVDDNGKPLTQPENGFFYNFVPIKLWDGIASVREYERVGGVFEDLYANGLTSRLEDGIIEELPIKDLDYENDYIISISNDEADKTGVIIKRDFINSLKADKTKFDIFNKLRTREKILHFAYGYPYFVAYKQGITISSMSKAEKEGWGIYHEMIDPNGSYATVVECTKGTKKVKFNEFYGSALSTMEDFGADTQRTTNNELIKMIVGESPISNWDNYVNKYCKENNGDKILQQVNAWYNAHKNVK